MELIHYKIDVGRCIVMHYIELFIQTGLVNIGRAIGIVLIGILMLKILKVLIRKAFAKLPGDKQCANRSATIGQLLIDIIKYSTYFAVVFSILNIFFGATMQSFLAFAGIGGIAIGFGAQNFIRDLISGFFLLLDGQLAVGDDVTIGNCKGVVEDMGLRATRVRGEEGELTIIPNGEIKVIINRSK